jgi:hypothetical protein
VVPKRTAINLKPFTPYASSGQASPQTIHDKTGLIPVNVTPSDDPEGIRYSFFKCEVHNWTDPHWDCVPENRVEVEETVPVDNHLYWCEEHSEIMLKNKALLFIAPFMRGDMWDTACVRWQNYDVTHG